MMYISYRNTVCANVHTRVYRLPSKVRVQFCLVASSSEHMTQNANTQRSETKDEVHWCEQPSTSHHQHILVAESITLV